MGEPDTLAVDPHHARPLSGLQPHQDVRAAKDSTDQLDGGFSGHRDGEQHRAHPVVETGEPGPHELGQTTRQAIG